MPNTFYPTMPVVLADGTEMPSYAHDGDAGLDLRASEDVTLLPGEWRMVGSGVSVAIPEGFVGIVVPRSGMGCKGLVLKNTLGVIDAPYRGEVKMPLFNNNPTHVWLSNEDVHWVFDNADHPSHRLEPNYDGTIEVRAGDRVAQLLVMPVACAELLRVDELDQTARGVGSFGSTGVRERP